MGATLLITRDERPGERELGEELGLKLVFVPLLRKTVNGERLTTEMSTTNHKRQATNIVFTSRNAVDALRSANLLNELRGRTIWCVGPATASALGDIPHHVSPGTTGEDLANFMLSAGVTGDVLHICGEPHRPELRATLERAGCDVKEWVVYETVPNEAELPEETIDAVAFFSPAAVKQFKALGWTESLQVPYIAIGPTTAAELLPSLCHVSTGTTFNAVLESTRKMLNVQL